MNAINRRSVLLAGLGLAGTGALAACAATPATSPALLSPTSSAVAQAEAERRSTGREKSVTVTAVADTVDLGGISARTWTYADVPASGIRLSAGDTLVATLHNLLPTATSIHWHGLAARNDMDGVPPITMAPVAVGTSFTYRFITEQPGTYWFHPHTGVQLDRGLYRPLVVEDPKEPLAYDDEWIVVLDDWLDGITGTPDQVLAELRNGMGAMDGSSGGMGGMDMNGGAGDTEPDSSAAAPPSASPGAGSPFRLMGARSELLGGDAGDVSYPYHLVNGRIATAPDVYRAKPGTRVRLRIINAGGDTAYRVALGGHRLTITHTDGYPVHHEEVDALLLGMGERYDVLVTLKDGVFPLTSVAEGKNAVGMALVRTGTGAAPEATTRPDELKGRLLRAADLRADDTVRLAPKQVDRTHRIELTGGMGRYDWGLNGHRFDMAEPAANPFPVTSGERVRLQFVNRTTMWHPMHLHGHTFQAGPQGPRKDTVVVLPNATVTCDFDADNPGQWLTHCHNVYHGEAGMMGLIAYTT